jgi:regulator of sigma E protease
MLLILALVLFVCLVLVHEYGHFIAARRSGVVVEEYGVGFPPKVWGKKLKSGLLLSINALPLGGFVRLKGENDADTAKGSYGATTLANKVKIMTAGVMANLATAIAIFTLLALIGSPKLIDNQFRVASDTKTVEIKTLVGKVEPGSPAEKAGLKTADQILSVAPTKVAGRVEKPEDLLAQTSTYAGQKVNIDVIRGGNNLTLEAQLLSEAQVNEAKEQGKQLGYLGVSPASLELTRSTWSAPIVGVGETAQFGWLTLKGVGSAIASVFSGEGSKAADQVAGPVGIFVILKDGTLLGFRFILMIIGLISLTLAIMNILPIPALDGGRLFVTLFYRAIKRPLTKEKEDMIHGIGFAVLMGLFVLITIIDVKRF